MDYNWDWAILITEPYLGWIAEGFGWTVGVSAAAWVIAFSLGSIIGILRTLERPIVVSLHLGNLPNWTAFSLGPVGMSKGLLSADLAVVLRGIGTLYVTVFRNVPLLVQMFLWYFVFPELLPEDAGRWVKRELPLPEASTAVFCLGLYTASRVGEQVRAGIKAITQGQHYAAMAMGLSQIQVYRYVLLPVSFRIIQRPLRTHSISLTDASLPSRSSPCSSRNFRYRRATTSTAISRRSRGMGSRSGSPSCDRSSTRGRCPTSPRSTGSDSTES